MNDRCQGNDLDVFRMTNINDDTCNQNQKKKEDKLISDYMTTGHNCECNLQNLGSPQLHPGKDGYGKSQCNVDQENKLRKSAITNIRVKTSYGEFRPNPVLYSVVGASYQTLGQNSYDLLGVNVDGTLQPVIDTQLVEGFSNSNSEVQKFDSGVKNDQYLENVTKGNDPSRMVCNKVTQSLEGFNPRMPDLYPETQNGHLRNDFTMMNEVTLSPTQRIGVSSTQERLKTCQNQN